MLNGMVEHDFPVVLGRDYAGVTGYVVGAEVYSFLLRANPTVHDGSWAELIIVGEQASVAAKPHSLDLAAAGAAPLAGITAIAVVDALALSPGETVLIIGATGGVGSFAVQLAVKAGATVIAPALPEDADYLRGLGVSAQPDRDGDIVATVRDAHPDGVEALIDLVSYTSGAFDGALRQDARVASSTGGAGEGRAAPT